jgi:integrase
MGHCTCPLVPVETSSLIKRFHKLTKNAGLQGVNFHALRHTYATRLLEANEHPKTVQELLGHADISLTLNTYSHVMPELKRAAAQKIDFLFQNKKVSTQEDL